MGGDDSPDSGKTPRVTGVPNKEQLERARRKYTKYDREANTEYERLFAVNQKKTLTANTDAFQHATFHHLTSLRIQGEITCIHMHV